MTVYIDEEYKCHSAPADGLITIDTAYFNGRCAAFVEGYRFIPEDESWTDERGTVYTGETAFPWKPYSELDAAQREYERELAQAARILLGEV